MTPIITAATAVVAGVPTAVNAVMTQLGPWAAYSPMLGQVVAALAVIGAAAAVAMLVISWLRKREGKL
jgi:hypothetical protein